MEDCSVKQALNLLQGKWRMRIIWELTKESPLRFNELQRRIGEVSALALSKDLKELEGLGIVLRTQYKVVPPRVEYSLTVLGQGLEKPLKALGDWGEQVKGVVK